MIVRLDVWCTRASFFRDLRLHVFSLHTLHESTTYPQQPNEITERDGPGNRGEPKGSCPQEHTKENA